MAGAIKCLHVLPISAWVLQLPLTLHRHAISGVRLFHWIYIL